MSDNNTETRVCATALFADALLALVKLICGRAAHSSSLFTDGIHSCADTFTSLMTFLGVRAGKNPDKKEKAEKYTVRFVCAVLFLTGLSVLASSLRDIVLHIAAPPVSPYAAVISAFALLVKEFLFLFSRYASKKTGSRILGAQAWHHQSDALSCVGSFIGIAGSAAGFASADKIAGIIISLMIIYSAYEILHGK